MKTIQATGSHPARSYMMAVAAIAAPVCLLLGWVILMGRAGNGPDTGWFVSHGLLIAGIILFIPAIIGLRTSLPGGAGMAADVSAGASLIGVAALVGQFAIDLVVGLIAVDQAAMSAMFRQIAAAPGIAIPFHLVGPLAFYGGLLTLIVLLMRRGSAERWGGILAAAGIIAVGAQAATGQALLALLGFAGMAIGFAPISLAMLRGDKGETVRRAAQEPLVIPGS